MHRELPSVARCCVCAPLRYGLLVWAYLKLVASIIAFGATVVWFIIWIFFRSASSFMLVVIMITALCLGVDIFFNFILILGSHKKNIDLLQIYYRYGIAHAIIFVILGVVWITLGIITMRKHDDVNSTHMIVAMITAIIGHLIFHFYLFILLRSEINKLKAKDQHRIVNQTAECSMRTDNAAENNTREESRQ